MKKEEIRAAAAIPVVFLAGLGLAWAGSRGGAEVWGLPLYGLLVGAAFGVQLLAFIPAFLFQTEKFYDLSGGLTYISVVTAAVLLNSGTGIRAWVMAGLVVIWALRLSLFLFRRVHKAGKDGRFDALKPSFLRFLLAWVMQGLWVSFTLAAVLVVLTSQRTGGLDIFFWIGLLVWLTGFAFEVTADVQKSRFRSQAENRGRFISCGLWKLSRHPNYFGEIVLWIGMAVMALPLLRGWHWVTLISPVFVTLLLTRISGIPLLEKRADERWGSDSAYAQYKRETPVLVPLLKR